MSGSSVAAIALGAIRPRRYDTRRPRRHSRPDQKPQTLSSPPAHQAADTTARLMLVGLSFCWGLTWPINRLVLYDVPPFSMRVATCLLGASLLFAIVTVQRRNFHIPFGTAWIHIIVAGTLNIAGFAI